MKRKRHLIPRFRCHFPTNEWNDKGERWASGEFSFYFIFFNSYIILVYTNNLDLFNGREVRLEYENSPRLNWPHILPRSSRATFSRGLNKIKRL